LQLRSRIDRKKRSWVAQAFCVRMRDRAHVAVSAFVNCPCAFTPGNQLGPEAGARLTSVPGNSIVERFADVVDVLATTIGGEDCQY
jgi:hypothetical protein